MFVLALLTVSAGLALTTLAPPGSVEDDTTPVAAPVFADELPGYYEFYKRTGSLVRLDDEITRDRSIAADGEWVPVALEAPAPKLMLPGADGELLPLRVGGPGRHTVVTTFQAWW